MKHYHFTPIDSWFFRESRSMDGSGATALNSIFPPANPTLLGALRTQIGNRYFSKQQGNWRDFSPHHELVRHIGYGQDYGDLKAEGVWLYDENSGEYYYSAPANIVRQGDSSAENPLYDFFMLTTKSAVQSDIGTVRLPMLKARGKNKQGIEIRDVALEEQWISRSDYLRVLRGEAPERLQPLRELLEIEPRLGISRDNQSRRTEEGMLYQTNHIRLKDGWHLYLGIESPDERYFPQDPAIILRLGGEARMAALQSADKAPERLPEPNVETDFVLYLLTPLPDNRQDGSTPPLPGKGFSYSANEQCWIGEIATIKVEVISAIVGKVQRIGGWDIAKHQSTPVRSYLPGGSCWYLRCQDSDQTQKLIQALHNQYLTTGNDRAQGYGKVVCGKKPTSVNKG